MRSRPRSLAFLLFAAVAAAAAGLYAPPAATQSDVSIGITTDRARRIRILQEAFRAEGDRGAASHSVKVDEVLYNDLDLSGFFSVTRGWSREERPFDVQAVVEGRLAVAGNQVTLTGEVKDFPARRLIGRSVIKGSLAELRTLTHRFADEVVYQITGERGIAETRIAYAAGGRGGRNLYVVDYDGHGARQLTQSGIAVSPCWAPDGSRIAFSWMVNSAWGLYSVPSGGGQATAVFARGGLNIAPSYAPDGSQIAFTSSYEGNSEIYAVAPGGGATRRLTKNRGIDTSPTWAPHGQQVAFTSDRGGLAQVYVMDADGANVRRLVYGYSYTDSPDWSPKGDRIAFVVRAGGGFDIYTVDVDGSDPRLVVTGGSNQNPKWSPDGRHLAFTSNRGGGSGLYVTDADGLRVRRLSVPGGEIKTPAWSPRPGPAATALGSR